MIKLIYVKTRYPIAMQTPIYYLFKFDKICKHANQ